MWSRDGQLKYTVRKLLRSPGFTALSVLTLALGIGANTAIFSVVNGVLLRPLPFPDAQELFSLWHSAPGIGIPEFNQSETTYTLYRELNRSFSGIGLVHNGSMNLTTGGEPVRVPAATATSSQFGVLGIPPFLGRTFTEEEDEIGAEQVVLLSYDLWRGRFGGDPGILGKTIELDQEAWSVIGVMPEGFTYPGEETQLWCPHRIDPADLGRVNFSYDAVGRLAPGVTAEAAAADLNQLLARLPEVYPGELTIGLMENAQMSAYINPLHEDVVGDLRQILWIVLGTVSFVLLIACANVANLFLVRAEGRQREIALRTALGAGRADLIRSFLTESIFLAGLGGLAGLGLAYAGIRGLVAISPENIPRLDEVGLHGTVLAFTAAISILAGILFGAIPLLRFRRQDLVSSINEGGARSSAGRETYRARNLLVVAQVALALVLLIGSGLMARSFWELRGVNPGFATEGILTMRLSLPEAEYTEARDAAGFYQRLLDDLRALPGVMEAGATSNLPLTDGDTNNGLVLEDFPLQPEEVPPIIRTNYVSPGYFATVGTPLREGRTFDRRDHEERTGACIVSRGFVERFWPGQSGLGRRLTTSVFNREDIDWYTIVGVVGDVHDDALEQPAPEMIYYPMVGLAEGEEAWVRRTMSVAVRVNGPPTSLAAAARQTVWSIDPRIPVANIRTMSEIVSASTARTAYTMLLLLVSAAIALLLGTVGIYGVISYVVSQRTREIGVRMALGAAKGDVSRMVIRQGLVIAAVGIGIGIVGGLAATRLMAALLFGVSTTDPLTYVSVSALLLAVMTLASYLPARRAAALNPVEALRYE